MEKTRLEAFTDAVFAIVVTLLVLDIRLPEGTTAQNLENNIIHILPALATYILSYLVVGLYWVFHHRASQWFKSADTGMLWLNIVYLLFIGLVPFSTSLLSSFTFTPWAILFYGLNLLAITLAGFAIVQYMYHHKHLLKGDFTRRIYVAQRYQYAKNAALYTIGIIFGFINPQISIYIYVFVTAYLILATLFPQLSWQRQFRQV